MTSMNSHYVSDQIIEDEVSLGGELKFQRVSLPSRVPKNVTFSNTVLSAVTVLKGFDISYGTEDHHVKSVGVSTFVRSISGKTVRVEADLEIQDASGHGGTGTADVVVLAKLASA